MRRVLAVVAAVVLVATLASSSLAAGPPSQVSRFVGNFELVAGASWTGGPPSLLHGRVVVNFTAPTDAKLVPGSLDVYMPSGSTVRESHAQLTWAAFGTSEQNVDGRLLPAIQAWTKGSWCDYRGPWDASCTPFIIVFQQFTDPGVAQPLQMGVAYGTTDWPTGPEADWYMAGTNGAWALTYAGPTFP